MAALLVTDTQAIAHLKIQGVDLDPSELGETLADAEAIILDYINTTEYWRGVSATWTAATVPLQVRRAILIQLGELWRGRGDDFDTPPPPREPGEDLQRALTGLLRRTSDPGMA